MSDETPNEIVEAARSAKERSEAAAASVADRSRNWPLAKIGLGVGIGSAAVAAAVLYANRPRTKK